MIDDPILLTVIAPLVVMLIPVALGIIIAEIWARRIRRRAQKPED